jgi:hypothetical protein
MIRVTWSRQCTWIPEEARPPGFGDDILGGLVAVLGKPSRIFATRREAEAFIATELRKCSSSGRNSEQGYWWGTDYESRRGVRVRFEMFDEPGSSAMFETPCQPFAPI